MNKEDILNNKKKRKVRGLFNLDIWSLITTLIIIGVISLLGIFLIVGIIILAYLALTGNRWD